MTNAQVREKIFDDHAFLRERIGEIEDLTARFEKEGAPVGAELRELGVALFETFASHIAFEDAQLVPALRTIPALGEEIADRLEREHCEQRELLQHLIARLEQESRPTAVVARELEGFANYLRQDMSHEESTVLREDLLER